MKKNKLIGSFMLFGTVLTLSACSVLDNFGGNSKSEDKTSNSAKTQESTLTKEEKEKKEASDKKEQERLEKKFGKEYAVGDTFKSTYSVRVASVKFEDNPNETDDVNKKKIAIVDVVVVNSDPKGQTLKLDTSNFKVLSGDEKISPNTEIEYKDKLVSTDLTKGKRVQGNLIFEVPEEGSLQLQFNPASWKEWTLKYKLR